MEFYFDKFKNIRKKQKITMTDFAVKAEITRRTLWSWENNKLTPAEKKIRKLAQILNVSVSEISSLEEEHSLSLGVIPSMIMDSWVTLANYNEKNRQKQFSDMLDRINSFNTELSQTTLVIKALLNSMNSIFYIKDTNQKYIAASKAFLEMFSVDEDYKILGKEDHNFFPLKDAEKNTREDRNVILTGDAVKNQEGFIPGTRNKRFGYISKLPILNSENRIVGLVGSIVDITERKREEYRRELLEINMETIPLAVSLVKNYKNKYVYINQAHEKIYGYPSQKFYKGGHSFWLSCVYPDDQKRILLQKNRKYWMSEGEYRIVRQDGEVRIINVTRSNITYNEDEYWIAISEDITEKKQKEKDLILSTTISLAKKLKYKGIDPVIISETSGLTLNKILRL